MEKLNIEDKIFNVIRITVFVTAISQLAVSQFAIRVTRLSAQELTGISFFAFIIFGLVTLFSVSKIGENILTRLFAIIMNVITSLSAIWYIRLLFEDEMFFKNLYYTQNRQTEIFELLPLGTRIISSLPVAIIILGIAVYCLCAFVIFIFTIISFGKKKI